jgi:HNH endonuclease
MFYLFAEVPSEEHAMQSQRARVVSQNEHKSYDGRIVRVPVDSDIRRMAVEARSAGVDHTNTIGEWECHYNVAVPDEGVPEYFMIDSILKMPDGVPDDDPERFLIPKLGVWRVLVTWRDTHDSDPVFDHYFEHLEFLPEDDQYGLPEPGSQYYLYHPPDYSDDHVTLIEGAIFRTERSTYERNSEARKLCIATYGTQCIACGLDFGQAYGPTAAGFIHVHHLEPLSATGEAHEVDPIRDLRPLCPNCHAVAHLRVPPFTVEEITDLLKKHGVQDGAQ